MNTPVKAAIAMAVLAGLWAGATAYSGGRVKTEMILQAESLRAHTQSPIRIRKVDYQKGFMSATRTLELEFGCGPEQGGKDKVHTMVWQDQIQHGPLPGFGGFGAARIDSKLVLSDADRAELKKIGMDEVPVSLRTSVGFDGASNSRLLVSAFTIKPDAEMSLKFQGLDANLQLNKDGSARYTGKLPGYVIESPTKGFKAVIEGAEFEGEGLAPTWWALNGKGKGVMKAMRFEAPGPDGQARTLFAWTDVAYQQDGRVADQLFSAEFNLQGKAEVAGVTLESIGMKGRMQRLQAKGWTDFVRGAWSQGCQSSKNPQAEAERLMAPLLTLLPHNPSMSVDEFKLTMGGRSAEFSYSIGTQGVTAEDLKAPALAPVLMKKAQFKMAGKLPLGFIEQMLKASGKDMPPEVLSAQLDQAVERGFVRREGELISAEMEMSGGTMKVNGKPIPLPGMGPQPELAPPPAEPQAQ
ncbi:YdgA family protein [Inhella sp.]|uniref:YdgA family protein n=1 Tax=Inhella sp. TaxID=1921806 RepID=UPI0035B16643